MNDNERALRDIHREKSLQKLANLLLHEGWFRTCNNCEHWVEMEAGEVKQICGKFNQRPPTVIIVSGCDDHSDNVPFDP